MKKLTLIALLVLCLALLCSCECKEHVFGEWETGIPATCTADGDEARICEKCGLAETRAVAATGHSFGEWVETTPATCTAEGTLTRTCEFCSETETQPIAVAEHTYDRQQGIVITTQTCYQDGEAHFYCTVCGAGPVVEHHPAFEHQYTQPTCYAAGRCTMCNKVNAPALGHSYNQHLQCTRCGYLMPIGQG